MFWTRINISTRRVILSVAVVGLTAASLITGAHFSSTNASTDVSANSESSLIPVTFPGTGVGAIPDGNAGTPPQYGTPLVVSFNVTGIAGAISDVNVNMTLTHSWVGDLEMVLAAPGGSPSLHLASRIGVTTATSFGDSSNFGGTYTFDDQATGTNIWTVATAAACGDTCAVAPASYRTVAPGQAGTTNPPAVTSLNTTFGSLTPAQANGTWTLTFRDAASADTGSVTAANLILDTASVATDAPVDFNGDSRSDYVVVRNVGGGASGQIRWFLQYSNAATSTLGYDWGLATDFFVSEDFDGDLKDDITVWRPGAATTAAFYILNSNGNTARVEAFGQTGDDPTVVGDYNNDGRADLAVYRSGAAAGQQSVWYYRTTANGPVTFIPWGQNGDFPAPGDYDGDGRNDFAIQRNNGGGQAAFWRLFATGTQDIVVFGTPTDVIVPGDYDGDSKTDIATIRGVGGQIIWFYDPSGTPGVQVVESAWGSSATDFPTQGDYDGDGRTDRAVWRPSATPGLSTFWVDRSTAGAIGVPFGQNGDYPVANYNSH